jgi:hypothetical protein
MLRTANNYINFLTEHTLRMLKIEFFRLDRTTIFATEQVKYSKNEAFENDPYIYSSGFKSHFNLKLPLLIT